MTHDNSKTLATWLLLCCASIFAIIIVGAITRLTESGLSMVEWRVAMDMLPPLSEAAWQSEFDLYKNSPEYKLVNAGMSLSEFKNIYFWEWFHRLLGRLVGLVYALPLFYFWVRGKIPPALKPRLMVFLFLGGLQGFFGWFMVKSGLVDAPRVSHFRLALHLGMALLLLCLLWTTALKLLLDGKTDPRLRKGYDKGKATSQTAMLAKASIHVDRKFDRHLILALILVCLTILYGAFVAGLDAGLIYNTFPLMGGRWIPSEFLFESPWWKNFFYNHATVQWVHRILGVASFVAVFALGLRYFWAGARKTGAALCALIFVQLALGIATLLSVVVLPLAVLHQGFAAFILAALTTLLFVRPE